MEEERYFRDGLVRYCGYANEVGESFKKVSISLFPLPPGDVAHGACARYKLVSRRVYLGSYGVASLYCASDAVAQAYANRGYDAQCIHQQFRTTHIFFTIRDGNGCEW